MAKRSLLLGITVALTFALAYSGHGLRKEQEAQVLTTRALHLLHASAAEAPDLAHVQAVQARTLLADALRLRDSDERTALRNLAAAFVYLQKADLARAEQRLQEAKTGLGETPDVLFVSAAVAHARGDLLRAGRDVQTVLGQDPKHTRARLLHSEILLSLGMSVEALNALDVLVHHEGDSASAENLRGVALERLERMGEAKAAFKQAITLDGRLYQPHLNFARRLQAEGRIHDALVSFVAAAERAPEDASPRLGMGLCRLSLGDLEGAETDLLFAAQRAPQDGSMRVALGDLAVKQGKLSEAAQRFTQALTLQPDLALAYLKLGNAQLLLGQPQLAVTSYRAAIARDANLSAAHNGLGAALMSLQDREGAALALATAAALDDHDPNPLLNLARLHRDGGDLESAHAALLQAQRRNPSVALAGL